MFHFRCVCNRYTLMAAPYHVPPDGPLSSYLDYIRSLPALATPEVFGLHENADITREQKG
jgi:dynein heavy chain